MQARDGQRQLQIEFAFTATGKSICRAAYHIAHTAFGNVTQPVLHIALGLGGDDGNGIVMSKVRDTNTDILCSAAEHLRGGSHNIHGDAAKGDIDVHVVDLGPIGCVTQRAVMGFGKELKHALVVIGEREVVEVALQLERTAFRFAREQAIFEPVTHADWHHGGHVTVYRTSVAT